MSQEENAYQILNRIRFNMNSASKEDINKILNNYNKSIHINPLWAACLNASYFALTGENHPIFMREQERILNQMIKAGEGISVNGGLTIYQKLKNNLTGKNEGILILLDSENNYMRKFEKIKYDIGNADLGDVKDILDHYNQDEVLINGSVYHFRPTVLQGTSLNARYFEITGHNHPIFEKVQQERLKKDSRNAVIIDGVNIYEELINGKALIGKKGHVLTRYYEIALNPDNATLKELFELLNYYNGKPVLIDGVAVYPFNDPISACKLNSEYFLRTGHNHPIYAERVPQVIRELMRNKEVLLQCGVYDIKYFEQLEQIMKDLNIPMEEKSNNFIAVNKAKFRQIYNSVRVKLIQPGMNIIDKIIKMIKRNDIEK